MACQRRISLAILAAFLAASFFTLSTCAALDGAQEPEAAPDRSRVVLVHQTRKLTYSDNTGDDSVITSIMGDSPMGDYGYYGGYGYNAPPGVSPNMPPGETVAPSEAPTAAPGLPPIPADSVGQAFRVTFPTPNGAGAILNNPSALAQFKSDFRTQIASVFSSDGLTADQVLVGDVKGTSSRRRSLLQSGMSVDYVMVWPKNTPESVLAKARETTTQSAGAVFPESFRNNFALGQPTVEVLQTPGGNTTPSPPTDGSNTNSPPGVRPPPPPPGSAARTPVSVAMVALSFFGSSMLLALLW